MFAAEGGPSQLINFFILFPYKLGRRGMDNASDVDIQVLIALKCCTRVID